MPNDLRETAIRELENLRAVVLQDNTLIARPVIEVDLGRSHATDEVLSCLRQLPELQRLYLDQTHVTDRVLEVLQLCPAMKVLAVHDTQITDQGLENLRYARSLEYLILGCNITDQGFRHVVTVTTLKELRINDSPLVTDKGLEGIENLKNLERLGLYSEQVTAEGIRHLKSLPKLTDIQLTGPASDEVMRSLVMLLQKELPNCKS